MRGLPIYVIGMGIVSPLGNGVDETADALIEARSTLRPLSLFALASEAPLPVGNVELKTDRADPLPRTHLLAHIAAQQALSGKHLIPDAIVVGTTTGGIFTTEELLEEKITDPKRYRYHSLGSVAEDLAGKYGCAGPLITVSTACSSGAVALSLAMKILRSQKARYVLAGGVDCLCRLTYFGFNSLQLIDPRGARPLDCQRQGLSLAEGAAMLLLTTERPARGALQLLGAGLSCDAYHPTAPLTEGQGALAAMQAALEDAALAPEAVDYINLHGTGTLDNDAAEIRAVRALFGETPPPFSSIKGAMGHSLAAAGAIEAVVAAIAIERGIVPANVGFDRVDPAINLSPVTKPLRLPLNTVLSNSFGFGGNNAAVVIGRGGSCKPAQLCRLPLRVSAAACLTGVGYTAQTWESFRAGRKCLGCLDERLVTEGVPSRTTRRLKRLPKLALGLAANVCVGLPAQKLPIAVSLATTWGPLSETHDFLQRLFETAQQFPSPTDFIGAVHNAPAGQIAMMLGAKGANVTTSGGNCSFEQALLVADLLTQSGTDPILLMGADEAHPVLSPLFDGAVRAADAMADGGGALVLERGSTHKGPTITLLEYHFGCDPDRIAKLVQLLGGADRIEGEFAAILVDLPCYGYTLAAERLKDFLLQSRFTGPVIDYRPIFGHFGTASAVAAVIAVQMVSRDMVPAAYAGGLDVPLSGKAILVLGLGEYLSAVRVAPQ
ncbi:MAG: beta-ketoacyl synthase N-terminal-like domain-containing protein [Syntrophobacteraceae bacterium]